jgi:hypothetical protein
MSENEICEKKNRRTFTAGLDVEHDGTRRLGQLGLDDKMRIASRAVFVGVFKFVDGRPPKDGFARFAAHRHFGRLLQRVVRRVGVALRAIEPLFATRCSNGALRPEQQKRVSKHTAVFFSLIRHALSHSKSHRN